MTAALSSSSGFMSSSLKVVVVPSTSIGVDVGHLWNERPWRGCGENELDLRAPKVFHRAASCHSRCNARRGKFDEFGIALVGVGLLIRNGSGDGSVVVVVRAVGHAAHGHVCGFRTNLPGTDHDRLHPPTHGGIPAPGCPAPVASRASDSLGARSAARMRWARPSKQARAHLKFAS